MGVIDVIWHGVRDGLLMAWEVWWALVLGFAISAIVQAWVPRARIQAALGGSGPAAMTRATLLGAASSSCSYAAVAIGRSLMEKGASVAAAFGFQFASTNLVWELGAVLWLLIGWQFTVAEYLGGIVMIALMGLLAGRFVGRSVEADARARLQAGAGGGDAHCAHHDQGPPDHDQHAHGAAASDADWRAKARTLDGWREVAGNFRADWQMLWREIATGFVLAGFLAQVPDVVWRAVFIHHAPAPLPAIENALVGPLIAIASFVCSVGNVPLAAVLWSGGIGFSGVLAFLFADLLVLPIIAVYRKTYGPRFTVRIVALMFVTMVIAALAVTALMHVLGWIPQGPRPTHHDVFGSVSINATFVLDVLAAAVFAVMVVLTVRRRETRRRTADPTLAN
jgi:uncharacterized membrane protein YraQ (UPF0718 family)